jgi:peptide/nickel transport system substrate-binding protein
MSLAGSRSSSSIGRRRPRRTVLLGGLVVALSVAGILVLACAPSAPPATSAKPAAGDQAATAGPPRSGGTLTVALSSPASAIDPFQWTSSWDLVIGQQIYDPLVTLDTKEPRIKPALADSWTASPDGMSYTFKLRQGVKFHDGTPFDAAAAKANFDRLLAAPAGAIRGADARQIQSVLVSAEAVDPTTLTVNLKSPSPWFLGALYYDVMVSPTAVQKWGADYPAHPVGTGPFRVKEFVPNDHLVLEKNPDYNWPRGGMSHTGPAYLDQVVYRFVNDPPARLLALESGDVDMITDVPLQDVARISADSRFKLTTQSTPGPTFSFYLNVNKEPFTDKQVRAAIMHGLNRDGIIKAATFGTRPPGTGLITSSTICSSDKFGNLFPFDQAKSKQMLDQAGWTPGADGMRDKGGKKLAFDLIAFPPYANMATAVQAQLRDVGIQVTPKILEIPAALPIIQKGDVEAWSVAGSNVDPSILTSNLHSRAIGSSSMGPSIVKDPKLDALLDAGAKEMDSAKRCQTYDQFQQAFLEYATAYPLYELGLVVGTKTSVQGLRLEPGAGLHPVLYEIWLGDR